jgi:hypothetical protein
MIILSEVAAYNHTNIWYRSGTDPVFQIAVGYGTDPWSGSEMGMRLKFTWGIYIFFFTDCEGYGSI